MQGSRVRSEQPVASVANTLGSTQLGDQPQFHVYIAERIIQENGGESQEQITDMGPETIFSEIAQEAEPHPHLLSNQRDQFQLHPEGGGPLRLGPKRAVIGEYRSPPADRRLVLQHEPTPSGLRRTEMHQM
ncbi:hypothetical protein ACOSP7_005333 [Xanthoceras sorbifolium]